MAITITPTTQEDAPALVLVGSAAFADDLLPKALMGTLTPTPSQTSKYLQWRLELTKARMQGAGKFYFKAVDSATGSIAGYIGFSHMGAGTSPMSTIPVPEWVDKEFGAEMRGAMAEAEKEFVGGKGPYWYIQSMAVHPDYQGKGVAKLLIQRALDLADEAGEVLYLESTKAGHGLYLRSGFEDLREVRVWQGRLVWTAMLRQPRASGSK